MRITVAAPAKVNLRLRVGPREPSGFHTVDTLFASLHLADTVVLRPGTRPAPTLDVGHARPLTKAPDLGLPDENLAFRAARAFMERAGLREGPEIRLVKRIPPGAGLGGGSSDAGAVLRGMNRLNHGALSAFDLMEIGEELGSDVPFFVRGGPLAFGAGRGERVTVLPPLPARPVVVVIPDYGVSTAEAYGWLDQDRPDARPVDPGPGHDAQLDWDTVAADAINHFEASIFRRHPGLQTLRDRLRDQGAHPALLAGSGSGVFGVFESPDAAQRCAGALRAANLGYRVLVTRTRMR